MYACTTVQMSVTCITALHAGSRNKMASSTLLTGVILLILSSNMTFSESIVICYTNAYVKLVYRARPIFRVKAQPETITPERGTVEYACAWCRAMQRMHEQE